MKSLIVLVACSYLIGASQANPCLGNPEGSIRFVNDFSSCSAYITCVGEIAHQMTCAGGLHFNSANQRCDFPSPDGSCSDCPDSDRALNLPISSGLGTYECKKYRVCFLGQSSIRECSIGLQFSTVTNRCELTDTVGCVVNTCPADRPGNPHFLPHPTRCDTYYLCQEGRPTSTHLKCPMLSRFDAIQQRCVPDPFCGQIDFFNN